MDLICASIACKYPKERLPVENGLRNTFALFIHLRNGIYRHDHVQIMFSVILG